MQMICNKILAVFGSQTFFFFYLALALLSISCERGDMELTEESVTWPEIARFDDIAFRADGYARVEDLSAVRELHAELLLAGKAVTKETIPSNVADAQQVERLCRRDELARLLQVLQRQEDLARRRIMGPGSKHVQGVVWR